MVSNLARLPNLRAVSLVTLRDRYNGDAHHRSLMEGVRDDIARRLPLLERIEVQWCGWKMDRTTKHWTSIPYPELLRLQWVPDLHK